MATIKPIALGHMAGLNNRLEPEDLGFTLANRAPATYLQAAENIDLLTSGRARRRKGFEQRVEAPAHSLWSDDKAIGFGVVDGSLKALTLQGDDIVQANIVAGLPNIPVSYSRGATGDVFWSNGLTIRRVVNDATDRPLAPPTPVLTLNPDDPATPLGSGALRAGRYLVALTMTSSDGESPATEVSFIDMPDGSSVELDSTASLNLYMSACNGDILTLQGTGTHIQVVTHNASGRRCQTLNKAVMPAGQIVRHWNGRLLVAAGNILYESEPYNYGIMNPSNGYVPFPQNIDMLEVVGQHCYIAYGDITQRFDGSLAGGLIDCLQYGALRNSSYESEKDGNVYWQTNRGLVVADAQGNVKNLQEDVLAMGDASLGATLYRESNGMRQVITTRQGVETSTAIATSYMDAEIIRKGTVL